MTRMRRHRQGYGFAPTVSLTPLIDTALTLLVVFMVAAPVAHRAVHVDLPRAGSAEQSSKPVVQEVVITVDRNGVIFANGMVIDRARFKSAVRELLKDRSTPGTVYLHVDKQASAGAAIELLAELRELDGIECVAFDIDTTGNRT